MAAAAAAAAQSKHEKLVSSMKANKVWRSFFLNKGNYSYIPQTIHAGTKRKVNCFTECVYDDIIICYRNESRKHPIAIAAVELYCKLIRLYKFWSYSLEYISSRIPLDRVMNEEEMLDIVRTFAYPDSLEPEAMPPPLDASSNETIKDRIRVLERLSCEYELACQLNDDDKVERTAELKYHGIHVDIPDKLEFEHTVRIKMLARIVSLRMMNVKELGTIFPDDIHEQVLFSIRHHDWVTLLHYFLKHPKLSGMIEAQVLVQAAIDVHGENEVIEALYTLCLSASRFLPDLGQTYFKRLRALINIILVTGNVYTMLPDNVLESQPQWINLPMAIINDNNDTPDLVPVVHTPPNDIAFESSKDKDEKLNSYDLTSRLNYRTAPPVHGRSAAAASAAAATVYSPPQPEFKRPCRWINGDDKIDEDENVQEWWNMYQDDSNSNSNIIVDLV